MESPAASTSLILPSGRTKPLVRGEGEPGGVLIEPSIFLREQDMFGEDDFIRPHMGAVLHAWRVGWNFAFRKEGCGCWPSFCYAAACSRPRLLSGS